MEVLRDVKCWEVSFEELGRKGTSVQMADYQDAESTAAVLRDVFPTGVVLDECRKLVYSSS